MSVRLCASLLGESSLTVFLIHPPPPLPSAFLLRENKTKPKKKKILVFSSPPPLSLPPSPLPQVHRNQWNPKAAVLCWNAAAAKLNLTKGGDSRLKRPPPTPPPHCLGRRGGGTEEEALSLSHLLHTHTLIQLCVCVFFFIQIYICILEELSKAAASNGKKKNKEVLSNI